MTTLAGPVTDPRAHALRRRYLESFGGAEFPVSVDAIAEDLLGLEVERAEIDCSGMLLPAERRILVNVTEPETRRRFTVAHELGHWTCQCLEGTTAPVFCRAEDVGLDPDARAREREANVFAAEVLMPGWAVRDEFAGSVEACARAFGVSEEAAHWRLYNLGLIEEKPT